MSTPPRRVQQLPSIEIPKELNPVYANMVRIAHMPSEFVIDFALKVPGNQPARVMAQVLMSPLSAKLFHRALTENLSKFENTFGEIKIPGESSLDEYAKLFRPPPKE